MSVHSAEEMSVYWFLRDADGLETSGKNYVLTLTMMGRPGVTRGHGSPGRVSPVSTSSV